MFGDGIMSAIDFEMDIQRRDPKGDRVVVTLTASSCRTGSGSERRGPAGHQPGGDKGRRGRTAPSGHGSCRTAGPAEHRRVLGEPTVGEPPPAERPRLVLRRARGRRGALAPRGPCVAHAPCRNQPNSARHPFAQKAASADSDAGRREPPNSGRALVMKGSAVRIRASALGSRPVVRLHSSEVRFSPASVTDRPCCGRSPDRRRAARQTNLIEADSPTSTRLPLRRG